MASFLISVKYNEDIYFSNEFYAKVGGIPLAELDKLEYEFLVLTNFNTFVGPDLYSKYYESFINTYTVEEVKEDIKEKEIKKPKINKKLSSETEKKTSHRKNSTVSPNKIGSAKKHVRSKS